MKEYGNHGKGVLIQSIFDKRQSNALKVIP